LLDSLLQEMSGSPSALVVLATGSEEMETVITVDVLRRAGVKVTLAGLLSASPVTCSRDVVLVPDTSLASVLGTTFSLVVLPGGGPGAKAFGASSDVKQLLVDQEKADRLIGAICAAPTALAAHGIGAGKKVTSYPAFKGEMEGAGYQYSEERVVVDGKLVTSRGPGTTFDFALELVRQLVGQEVVDKIAPAMLL